MRKKINGLEQCIINMSFNAEISETFKAIKNVTSSILQENTVCNLKVVIGMVIVDGLLFKRIECKKKRHIVKWMVVLLIIV